MQLDRRVRVVGIGASAGGLEALERFFEQVPSASRIAWIVVQHLSPDHKSLMSEILGKRTALPVTEAQDGEVLEGGHVYLGPARSLVTLDGPSMQVRLKERTSGLNLPIDALFRSLAEQLEEDSVGVVLSGTGSDGRLGLEAIKAAGGLLVAQEPSTARFDGMPLAAVSTGQVDLVLPPEAMAGEIARVLADGPGRAPVTLAAGTARDEIFGALLRASSIDFTEYKSSTLTRRIERRMVRLGIVDLDEYARRITESHAEAEQLGKELLINVTRFFRDEAAFEALRATAIEDLVSRAKAGDVLRVWVAGCSTGQEAYSTAMLFAEAVSGRPKVDFKIFATDVDRAALEQATAAVYPAGLLTELTRERIDRFLMPRGDDWQVQPELRRHVVFAPHNLVRDPPFTRLDLVLCRNVLIYLAPHAQKRVLSAISFAVKPSGYVMLGSSETFGEVSDRFRVVDAQWRLAQRLSSGRTSDAPLPLFSPPHRAVEHSLGGTSPKVVESAFRVLIDKVAQAAVLVSPALNVVAVYGNAEAVLQVPLGAASLSVLAMLPPVLRAPTTLAFHRALGTDEEAVATLAEDTPTGVCAVRCIPLTVGAPPERHVLVVFERGPSLRGPQSAGPALVNPATGDVTELQDELQRMRDRLQTTVEQLETSNEELQAANEELLAANEELQSTNEELQSVNEELNTVNAEHQEKIRELTSLNADLDNMFKASTFGTVFLDRALTIRRFTPALAAQFSVLDRDIGRPISDLSAKFGDPRFIADLHAVVETGDRQEREVQTRDGRAYLMRLLPFLSEPGQIQGAVVTFADVTPLKQAEGSLVELQRVLDSLLEQVAVLDGQGRVRLVNRAWREFGARHGPTTLARVGVSVNYLEVSRGEPPVFRAIEEVLAGRLQRYAHEYACHSNGARRWFRLNVSPLQGEVGAVVSHFDITGRVESDPTARVEEDRWDRGEGPSPDRQQ